ncbi:hypothetical protein VTJ04DRAFT_10545 [Mycothermus thermophilus]|uniref:uncharacterized protein n=1 Tax=Humicola insolens TaxID=85995 RepID=UPI003742F672
MALISAKTILTSLCLFHLSLAFFFLTNPASIAEQSIVYVLGESMGLPGSRSFEQPSPALGLLAAVLAIMGISDLSTLSLPDEVGLISYWGMQAPLRLTLTFFLALYSFFFSPSSPLFYTPDESLSSSSSSDSSSPILTHPSVHRAQHNPAYQPSGWGGDALKNRVFFSFMFVETVAWLWAWVTLSEENRELMAKKARKRRSSDVGY